jgi:heme/copper-type cytochrome/quinol oxidase subunit 3
VRERVLGVTAMYWHFMGGLWVYLMVLLFVWR